MHARPSPPDAGPRPAVSVVIPVYNEERSLDELHSRLRATLEGMGATYELVFVDDGSRDGSADVLRRLAADTRVKAVILSRNFNQHAAIAAGFAHTRGDHVVLMDADLQDLPEEMPKLLAKAAEGHDVVYGVREVRQDSLLRRVSAWGFFAVFSAFTGMNLPRGVSTYRVVSRRFADAFNALPERNRLTAGMMAWLGFGVAFVPIRHEERKHGTSNYSMRKLIRLALDGVVSFSDYPLRLASKVGIALSGCSFLFGCYMVLQKLFAGIDAAGYASIITCLAFFSGLQLLFMGIIGEYLSRVYRESQGRPLYVVKEALNLAAEGPAVSRAA
jgi:dolichol-phosphate mannosyltransferase